MLYKGVIYKYILFQSNVEWTVISNQTVIRPSITKEQALLVSVCKSHKAYDLWFMIYESSVYTPLHEWLL